MNLLKFYKVDIWIRNLGIPFIGILSLEIFPNPLYVAIILLQLAFLQAFSFAINDYFDSKIRKEKTYMSSLFKIYSSYIVLFFCIVPLILLIITFFIFHGNLVFLLLYIIIYDILYEVPPFRLKKSSFFSLISSPISLVLLLYLYAYLSFTSTFSIRAIAFLIIFFFYMAFHEMIHQIAHSKREKVLPKVLGMKGGIKIAQVLLSIPILVSIFAILLGPARNYIFVITLGFSILRIYKLCKIKLSPEEFEKIKISWHKFYSVHEGIIYVIFLALAHFGIF